MLLREFPAEAPGDLARRHAALASGEALAAVGRSIGLHRHLDIQPGLARDREAIPTSVIEDGCEALIGAVYLDAGHDAACAVVERFWRPMLSGAPPRDAKTALQEWAQARGLPPPAYRTADRGGPDHVPVFTVEARIEGFPEVEASAGSKRAAERAAARLLLDLVDDGGGVRAVGSGERRCGFVAVIGAPNVGKSTLTNRLVGAKVSIVTSKVQTTRSRVIGVAAGRAGAARLCRHTRDFRAAPAARPGDGRRRLGQYGRCRRGDDAGRREKGSGCRHKSDPDRARCGRAGHRPGAQQDRPGARPPGCSRSRRRSPRSAGSTAPS